MSSLVAPRPVVVSLARRAARLDCAAALFLAVAIQGCAAGDEGPGVNTSPVNNVPGSDAGNSQLPPNNVPGNPVGPLADSGGIVQQPAKDGGAPVGTGVSSGLPCNIQKIVTDKCAKMCHSDPPQGAPTALTKQAYWQAIGNSDKTKKYFELAKVRVNAADNAMPPRVSDQLTAEEKTALNTWLNAGAPASTETCAGITTPTPDAGVEPPADTTGLTCYKFLAHAQGDKNAKYKVGAVVDKYMFFGFKAPWQGTVYGQIVRPVIDNSKALHHWLLYKENVADGSVQETIGQHNGGELIHGWAPGGIAMDFRKHGDVSFELPASSYGLELHYNSSDAAAADSSGAEICVTTKKTANIASMTWLGYDQGGVLSYGSGGAFCLEADTTWNGTCKPATNQPIHLLFMTPHLHQAGRHLKSVINGPSGSRVLHDKVFDFNYQVTYETDEVLMPGETITTTCTFSEPKCAGQSTSQEMCYNFTYAYPAHALVDNGPEGTLMHGTGVCLGQ